MLKKANIEQINLDICAFLDAGTTLEGIN